MNKIDRDHYISGSVGYMRLPGKFSSHVDKYLKMNHHSFYKMNMNYQKKCVQDI